MINVYAQPYEALLLFHGGAAAGLLYLLLRVPRNLSERRITVHLIDALFVLLLTVILWGYLYLANCGTVRGFAILAFILGFAAFYALFSPLFNRMTQKIRKK